MTQTINYQRERKIRTTTKMYMSSSVHRCAPSKLCPLKFNMMLNKILTGNIIAEKSQMSPTQQTLQRNPTHRIMAKIMQNNIATITWTIMKIMNARKITTITIQATITTMIAQMSNQSIKIFDVINLDKTKAGFIKYETLPHHFASFFCIFAIFCMFYRKLCGSAFSRSLNFYAILKYKFLYPNVRFI